jgi:hemolysin III
MPSPLPAIAKPKLRGVFHLVAFFLATAAAIIFIILATPGVPRAALATYFISLSCMYGISALYHVPTWKPRARKLLKRLDHAAIFILIGGSYAPVCLLALDPTYGVHFLKAVGLITALGVLQSLFWIKAPKFISIGFYLFLGWLVVIILPELIRHAGPLTVALIFLSGLIYMTGALIYGFKKPNPWPKYFGYHEIFHVLVIFASGTYCVAVARLAIKF